MQPDRFAFFLGGQDLEMEAIAALLAQRIAKSDGRVGQICNHHLAWGARASDYRDQIAAALAAGLRVVLVELAPDLPLPETVIVVDHHGQRSAEPSALEQVFTLLSLPADLWTRDLTLVAANDLGHVAAMRAMGATAAEIAQIRARDRAAQGITAAQEAEGAAALLARREGLGGTIVIVDLPHGHTATVADPLALSGERRDLLILSPASTNFFGTGKCIATLDAAFPGGWRGGELPLRGFWGVAQRLDETAILAALAQATAVIA